MSRSASDNRNLRTLAILVGLVAFMTGLAYASVPLYRLFCQVTGYGGTPQRADAAPAQVGDRVLRVTFTADVAGGLGWQFQPLQRSMELKVGENKLAFYVAENLEQVPVTGQATFNVSPDVFGPYFTKIECFCFTEQTLQPGQRVEMPVSFFIDPAVMDAPELRHITDVTLSYTFFRAANQPSGPQAAAGGGAAAPVN